MLEETVVTVVLVVILVEEMYAWRIAKLDINTKIKICITKNNTHTKNTKKHTQKFWEEKRRRRKKKKKHRKYKLLK